MDIEEEMIHAWVTWVDATGLDLSVDGWKKDPRNTLFDKLIGSKSWLNKDLPCLTEAEKARIRGLADQRNGYTYAKALLAKYAEDHENSTSTK